ncbi:alpha-2,8-polysialyltransferase family protein [Streptomyces niveiscabiei]|uniref:alpha-2,8-polysialyltransferase family protein n=1 Tax=Streptomyces niveiscabiei TaxID=164115 RepID=UPI0006EBBB43|nr:alpha-2,8-polysialyltransferase family protein [Streptomyces niveiscabiei]
MPRTTQIYVASTLYGVATIAAAMDSDAFPAADRRLLLVCNNANAPETVDTLEAMPGFAPLRRRFDGVLSWNEAISPFHPSTWSPRADDTVLFERYLRMLWNLGDDRIEIVLESLQVNPAQAIAACFFGAPVDVYADGLMTYGPTRNKVDPLIGTRVRRVLHLDLVPGEVPLVLTEFGVPAEIVPTDAFLKVLGEITDTAEELPRLPDNSALLLGQYLAALDILTVEEEEALHVRMLRGAVAKGHTSIAFKPHPSAPAGYSTALEAAAKELGADLLVLDTPVLAEVLFATAEPALVVGCFSTALFTAKEFYGIPVARVGTPLMLERLVPFQNSNRVPVILADALLPDLEGKDQPVAIDDLLETMGFVMQAQIYPHLRPVAEKYLSTRLTPRTQRFFRRRRLTALGLPGGIPARLAFLPRNATARRVVRRARALKKSVKK